MLLLDEPLGALDLKLREAMQEELKALQRQVGITFVYVTHDQGEALAMSDRVAVFNHGRVEQIGTPAEIYDRPATAFVAGFVGASNMVDAATAGKLMGQARPFALRPERIRILNDGQPAPADAVEVAGTVDGVSFLGATTRYRVALAAGGAVDVVESESRHRPQGAGPGGAAGLAARPRPSARGCRGMTMAATLPAPAADGIGRRAARLLYRNGWLLLILLLAPPLLWLGVVYLGSLFALLLQSFFSVDGFTGMIVRGIHPVDLCRAADRRQHGHGPAHRRDGGGGDDPVRADRASRSPTTRRATPAAGPRRSSTSRSCCRCGRATWCGSMPGS